MNDHEQKRFDQLYQRHVRALKLRGYAVSTIDVYARAASGGIFRLPAGSD